MAFKMKDTGLYKIEKRKNSAYPSKDTMKSSDKFKQTVSETKKLETTDEKAENLSKTYGVNFTYKEDKDGVKRYLTEDGRTARKVAIDKSREEKNLPPITEKEAQKIREKTRNLKTNAQKINK